MVGPYKLINISHLDFGWVFPRSGFPAVASGRRNRHIGIGDITATNATRRRKRMCIYANFDTPVLRGHLVSRPGNYRKIKNAPGAKAFKKVHIPYVARLGGCKLRRRLGAFLRRTDRRYFKKPETYEWDMRKELEPTRHAKNRYDGERERRRSR